ncbi:MAG: hypothetical protein IPM32_01950 [Ignavibacteriae bacterium]|nr:hypothetical protein [Ignavibacteriota bacterium]
MHINFKTLQYMLTILYQYDNLNDKIRKEKPFRIKIYPILLTVNNEDYIQFKEEVEKAVTKYLIIPQFNNYNYLNN